VCVSVCACVCLSFSVREGEREPTETFKTHSSSLGLCVWLYGFVQIFLVFC